MQNKEGDYSLYLHDIIDENGDAVNIVDNRRIPSEVKTRPADKIGSAGIAEDSTESLTDIYEESKENFSKSETTEKETAEVNVSKLVNIHTESAFSRGRNAEPGQNVPKTLLRFAYGTRMLRRQLFRR